MHVYIADLVLDLSNACNAFCTDPFDLNHNLGAGLSRKSKSPVNKFGYKVKILS